MQYLITISLAALLVLLFSLPYIKSNLSDIDPEALKNQSSIGPTRNLKETAIYRSVDVPHGVALSTGLRIRHGGYKLRDGCLKDVWLTSLNIAKSSPVGGTIIKVGDIKLGVKQVNWLISELGELIGKGNGKIGLFSGMNCLDSLLVILSCFLYCDRTLINLNSLSNTDNEYDVLFVDFKHYRKVLSGLNGVTKVVVMGAPSDVDVDKVVDNVEIISFGKYFKYDKEEIRKKDEFKEYDSTKTDDSEFNNHPYSEINNGSEIKFFQRNFVSSIASQLMSLNSDICWNQGDKLLIGISDNSISKNNLVLKLLSGLLGCVKQIEVVDETQFTLKNLQKCNPNIISFGDESLKRILMSTKCGILQKWCINRSEYFNSVGIFNQFGMVAPFEIRLVYSIETGKVSSRQYNVLRTILGSRIIREKFIDLSLGPILKTNLFDNRILNKERFNSFTVRQLGVASNSNELKLKKIEDEENTGELYGRGFNLGKAENEEIDEEYFVKLGIHGKFGSDGCFYQYYSN